MHLNKLCFVFQRTEGQSFPANKFGWSFATSLWSVTSHQLWARQKLFGLGGKVQWILKNISFWVSCSWVPSSNVTGLIILPWLESPKTCKSLVYLPNPGFIFWFLVQIGIHGIRIEFYDGHRKTGTYLPEVSLEQGMLFIWSSCHGFLNIFRTRLESLCNQHRQSVSQSVRQSVSQSLTQ